MIQNIGTGFCLSVSVVARGGIGDTGFAVGLVGGGSKYFEQTVSDVLIASFKGIA